MTGGRTARSRRPVPSGPAAPGGASGWAKTASVVVFALAALLGTVGLWLAWKAYAGGPAALPMELSAAAGEGPGSVTIIDLGRGRYHVRLKGIEQREVVLTAKLSDAERAPRLFMHRLGTANTEVIVRVDCGDRPGAERSFAAGALPARRTLVETGCPAGEDSLQVTLRLVGSPPIVLIDELGFFDSSRGLMREQRRLFATVPDTQLYRVWLGRALRLLAFCGLLLLALAGRRSSALAVAAYCAGITLAITSLGLWNSHMPIDAAAEPIPLRAVRAGVAGQRVITLQPTTEPVPLGRGLWTARSQVEFQPRNGLLTTDTARFSYALDVPLRASRAGLYEFRLRYTAEEGDILLAALSADRQTAIAQGRVVRAAERHRTQMLEVELAAGEAFWLLVSNNRPSGDVASRVRVRRLEAAWRPARSANPALRDLRSRLAGPLIFFAGANENYGAFMGINLLDGNGPVEVAGHPPWNRMPGYAFVTAAAALLAGSREPIDVLLSSVFVHIALLVLATAAFGFSMTRLRGPLVAALVVTVFVFSPTTIWITQVDSIMAAVAFLVAAAGCVYLGARQGGALGWRHELLLHASFALWFAMRPDALPGWALVSLILAWRRWRKLIVPLCLFLAIGVPWALFKHRHTDEFVMTTNSFGISAMIGLWEVPNRFKWPVADSAYHEWLGSQGLPITTSEANSFATREVVRFCLTYPGYVAVLAFNELVDFVERHAYGGHPVVDARGWLGASYPVIAVLPLIGLQGPFTWLLLALMTLSLVVGYQRVQTVLLGWSVWFVLPAFFLVFSSVGRFYPPIVVAMLTAGLALLLDRGFWRALGEGRWRIRIGLPARWGGPRWLRGGHLSARAAAVMALFLVLAVWGVEIEAYLLDWDALRYWTPLLDPADSTLSVFKDQPAVG